MFAGVVGAARLCDRLQDLAQRSEGLAGTPFDERAFWREGDAALLQQRQWHTPELRLERGVLRHEDSGALLVSWLRLDNRDELRRQLGPGNGREAQLDRTDGGLALRAWLRWGADCAERLLGDFAIAVYDPRDRSCLLIRDAMGVKPLYYAELDGGLAFAAGLDALAALGGEQITLSEKWLALYVAGCASHPEKTVYREVRKTAPGHLAQFRGGRVQTRRYFTFDPDARDDFRSSAERREAYRALLTEVTACRVRTDGAVACELSGGLDSSTAAVCAALAMEDAGERLHSLAFANLEQEPQAILSVSQTVPMVGTHVLTGTHLRAGYHADSMKRLHRSLGAPIEHANSLSHAPFYHLAQRHKARVLLSGFGGDEFVTLPDAQVTLESMWRDGQYAACLRRLPGPAVTRPLACAAWRLRTLGVRLDLVKPGLYRWAQATLASCLLPEELQQQYGVRDRLWRQAGIYDRLKLSLNEYCLRRWYDRPSLVSRLENCTAMAAAYGLDYRWPLLDVRLIAFFLAAPAAEKVGPGFITRYFHRQALAGLLPDLVVWKNKSMGEQVVMPERWRRRRRPSAAEEAARDLGYDDLNPLLRPLLDPKRYQRAREESKVIRERVRAGLPRRRNRRDMNYIHQRLRRNVHELDQWLSAAGRS